PKRIALTMDDRAMCTRTVSPRATLRIDCAWEGEWLSNAVHQLEATIENPSTSGASSWSLTYLELATHHGATRAYDLMVLPVRSGHFERPTLPWIIVVFLLLFCTAVLPESEMTRSVKWVHRVVSGSLVVFLALVFVSSHLSSYVVLLSTTAFVEAAGMLLAPRIWRAGAWAFATVGERSRLRAVMGSVAAASLVLASYGLVVSHRLQDFYHGNYSGFLQLSRATFDRNPMLTGRSDVRGSLVLEENGGYDGQYMYFETFDPFLRQYRNDPAVYGWFIDAPPYRFGRIGFSVLTKVFSGDQWQLYPKTMMWLDLAALFGCAIAMSWLAVRAGRTSAWGLVVVLVPGFWQSLQASLPEPIAAALLLAGYLCLTSGLIWSAGLLFAGSLLVRETGVIFVLLLIAAVFVGKPREGVKQSRDRVRDRDRMQAAIQLGLISLIPLAIWRLYVGWILAPHWGAQAFWWDPHDLGTPFAGILDLWGRVRLGTYFPSAPDLARAGIWYPLLLLGALLVAFLAVVKDRGPTTVAAVIYGILGVSLTYDSIWVHVGNAQRGTYEVFIVLASITVAGGRDSRASRLALTGFWVAAAAYVFIGGLDADYIRGLLLAFS
ncbi:MAG TPA: hypothetical protein VNZ26_20965, partial [Vicinamibacterales bacterium]|nr:hypothetical protein [Vicinamibacterales bacterium]